MTNGQNTAFQTRIVSRQKPRPAFPGPQAAPQTHGTSSKPYLRLTPQLTPSAALLSARSRAAEAAQTVGTDRGQADNQRGDNATEGHPWGHLWASPGCHGAARRSHLRSQSLEFLVNCHWLVSDLLTTRSHFCLVLNTTSFI